MKAGWVCSVAAAIALIMAGQAGAAVDEEAFKALARKKGCFNCHKIDRPVLGPSLRDIGMKYRGDAGAQRRLAGIIRNGSKGGVWSNEAMPAYARLSDDDINTLVRFILALE